MDLGGLLRGVPLQEDVFLFGTACFVVIALFAIFIFVAIWVYRDAESRGMNGALWLIVVLVAPIIGLIIYLVVRTDHPVRPPGWYPPAYPAYPGYPPYPPPGYAPPGYAAPPPQQAPPAPGLNVACKSCGTVSPQGLGFCRQCGAKL